MSKGKIHFFIILAVVFLFFILLPYYLFFTTRGSIFIVKLVLSKSIKPRVISIQKAEGSLAKRLSLQNIRLEDIKDSPDGTVLEIQKSDLYFSSISISGINVDFDNGRLILPAAGSVLLNGSYKSSILNLKMNAEKVDIEKLLNLFPPQDILNKLKGGLAGANIDIKGPLEELTINGTFKIEDILYDRFILQQCEGSTDIKVNRTSKRPKLDGDISFEDLALSAPDIQNAVLRVQKINLSFLEGDIQNIDVQVDGGRLKLAGFDAILFSGSYLKEALDFNIYSNYVSVGSILKFFPENEILDDISGTIKKIDLYVKGSFLEPEVKGEFEIEKLLYKAFSMVNCPGAFNLQFKDIKDDLKLYGKVDLKSGEVSGPRAAVITLKPGEILFNGDFKNPSFDLKGGAVVEEVKIDISLKGTIDKPDLKLTSQPPMVQERLLVMLATNKSWESVTQAFAKGELSADMAKDFLDYFIFSGSGNNFIQKFGLSGISLKYDGETRGVGVRKKLFDKLEAAYSVEQPQLKENGAISHKLGAEYKITDQISLGAEQKLNQDSETEEASDEEKTNGKVILKYKKEF